MPDNKMTQGEQYEEEQVDFTSNGNKSKSSNKLDTKKTMLIFATGAAILLICMIAFFVNSQKKKAAEKKAQSEIADEDYDPFGDVDDLFGDEVSDEYGYHYTPEEKRLLTAFGYTVDEIEMYELQQVDFYELQSQAEQSMDEYLRERYFFLKNSIPEEIKNILDKTIFGGEETPVIIRSDDIAFYADATEIVTYEKLPSYGGQCMVKITLESGINLFMFTNPERYDELLDKGNMVVTLSYIDYDGKRYYCDIEEKQV